MFTGVGDNPRDFKAKETGVPVIPLLPISFMNGMTSEGGGGICGEETSAVGEGGGVSAGRQVMDDRPVRVLFPDCRGILTSSCSCRLTLSNVVFLSSWVVIVGKS